MALVLWDKWTLKKNSSPAGSKLFTRELLSGFILFSKEFIYCLSTIWYKASNVNLFFRTSRISLDKDNGHLLVFGQV